MKKRREVFLFLALAVFSGCSKTDWMSKIYMLKAENALSEAVMKKEKKVSYEQRVPYYARACENFRKAYDLNPEVFTLNRIEEAADACWRADDRETEDLFKEFEAEYSEKHPQEVEHGDSGVAMMEMG